jgi:hypothetical protein
MRPRLRVPLTVTSIAMPPPECGPTHAHIVTLHGQGATFSVELTADQLSPLLMVGAHICVEFCAADEYPAFPEPNLGPLHLFADSPTYHCTTYRCTTDHYVPLRPASR